MAPLGSHECVRLHDCPGELDANYATNGVVLLLVQYVRHREQTSQLSEVFLDYCYN